jgi:PGF-CTERM protein
LTVTNDAGETDTTTTSITVNAVDTSAPTEQPPDGTEEPPETTEEWIPGFTGVMTLLALIASALIARRYAD